MVWQASCLAAKVMVTVGTRSDGAVRRGGCNFYLPLYIPSVGIKNQEVSKR